MNAKTLIAFSSFLNSPLSKSVFAQSTFDYLVRTKNSSGFKVDACGEFIPYTLMNSFLNSK